VFVYLGVGSNLGDRPAHFRAARTMLQDCGDFREMTWSGIFETRPVGGPQGQGDYLNAVVRARTELGPLDVLAHCKLIERELGRSQGERWGPRVIDLDLLLYGEQVIELPGLIVPHPRLHQRRFVLQPLAELAPTLVHPRLSRDVKTMLEELPTGEGVIRLASAEAVLASDNRVDWGERNEVEPSGVEGGERKSDLADDTTNAARTL
jgi:2-amino-4-hydroxy-6-hydroxymethyldihydropteridine diphosphokinase